MQEKLSKLKELVFLFNSNLSQYKSQNYDEANLRVDFADKFFEILDWDVRNTQGFAENYRDVVREDKIIITGKPKAPDYSFRIGGHRKFFVETKRPSVNIKEDGISAFQVRRYGYTAKLPLCILTDFEEFAVYDTRIKPAHKDNSGIGREFYCTFDEYEKHFEFIYNTFSKNAIIKGSFDKYINKKKKGTSEVDKEFLKLIEGWRTDLAKNIAKNNLKLNIEEINFAVQKIINRIIFLRIAEDRHVEDYETLKNLTKRQKIYKNFSELCIKADNKYNSQLFYTEEYLRKISIDDDILTGIIEGLYYPECPYEFSVMEVEILGNIYEQFLGKIIRLTASHLAKVEEKPEVRKAGGVYYTPQYIVDYIVENTVGEKIKSAAGGKKPKEIESLKILDPACGSGSFLLGAYSYLMEYHHKFYTNNENLNNSLKEGKIYQLSENNYKLTIEEKRKILLNNLFGVDIDSQAVEVTKLSLLLKLMENENQESVNSLFKYSDLKVLPDLSSNIKCGNSLIGTDFYAGQDLGLFENKDMKKVNAFDWDKEFLEIFKNGGFDVVIGNPPYLRIQGLQENYDDQIEYFIKNYQSAIKRFDIYLLFIEKGFKLLRQNGLLGYICPHKFLNSDFGSGIREFISTNHCLKKIISFGHNSIFEQASTYTGILLLSKENNKSFKYFEFLEDRKNEIKNKLFEIINEKYSEYNLNNLSDTPWNFSIASSRMILEKIKMPIKIKDTFKFIMVGVQSGIDEIHILKFVKNIDEEFIKLYSSKSKEEIIIERKLLKPFLMGDDVKRYQKPSPNNFVIYPYKFEKNKTLIYEENELSKLFPRGYNYLQEFKKELLNVRKRQKTNSKYWYSCHRARDMNIFEQERIITPYASLGCNMTICKPGIYHNTKVYSLVPNEDRLENKKYWLALFNSKIMWYFMKNTGYVLRGGYYTFTTDYLSPFSVKTINFSKSSESKIHDELVFLVDQMLTTQKEYHSTKNENEKETLKKKIEIIDNQIDLLVYELYGLTEEEIRVVEGK